MKKLPSVYKNTVAKSTNKKMFYSAYDKNVDQERSLSEEVGTTLSSKMDKNSILNVLNDLFQSRNHAYTKVVEVKTKNQTYQTRLVFMTDRKIVTIDNEEIYLDDIISIQI